MVSRRFTVPDTLSGMSDLTGAQRRFLRARAQADSAAVSVGTKGLTDEVRQVLDKALASRELVKVRLPSGVDRKVAAAQAAEAGSAALVGLVGRVALLYRPDPDSPKFTLPN